MKHIYFVRHGESEQNVNPGLQGSKRNTLTEKGLQQAKTVAERFKNIKIDILIHTSKIRAQQTAEAIYHIRQVEKVENDLFLEREGDFEIIWEFKHLPEPELIEAMRKKLKQESWHYKKQELFEHLKERAKKGIEYLELLPQEHIAVVTHGAFLKFLILYILIGENADESQYVHMMQHMAIQNTGITYCKFTTEPEKKWRLITWNDQSHLG